MFLFPDGPAARHGYDILCQAMEQRSRWAVGRMVLSGQRQVVLVRPAGSAFILHILHYPEFVRAWPAFGPAGVQEASQELQLAGQLIDAASAPADWSSYRDETTGELRALIEAKLQGRPAEESEAPAILPLLEALQQSVAGQRKTASRPSPSPKKSTPRKRTRRTA